MGAGFKTTGTWIWLLSCSAKIMKAWSYTSVPSSSAKLRAEWALPSPFCTNYCGGTDQCDPRASHVPKSCYTQLTEFLLTGNPPITKPVFVDGDAGTEIAYIFMPWVVFDPTVLQFRPQKTEQDPGHFFRRGVCGSASCSAT
jgi:hypothetical protein